ncbi:MAG: zinc metalloprotease HtpX [Gemmatimonadota bacterium]
MQRTKVFGLMAVMTAMLAIVGGVFGGRGGALTFFLFAALMNFGMYWFSDRMVLRMYRARIVGREDAPDLYALVDRLRQRAGLPMPTVALAPQKQPNAFATGRNPEHAVVCCTTGLLELMNEREIEGVLAHELGHIKHRHMLTGTVAATMAGAIASLSRWGFLLSRGEDRNPFVGIAMMIVAPIAAAIVQMAISRQNEFQADRAASEIVGSPHGLISALERLDAASRRIPMDVNPAAAQLAIVNPLAGVRGMAFTKLFSTHPPTVERIAALRALA